MSLQVFILTHNRPDSLLKTLQSVLRQTYTDYELIVSDNSDNDLTREALHRAFPEGFPFQYRQRVPCLSSNAHFNQVLTEVTADYFMLFHDDDLMHDDLLETAMSKFANSEDIVAVASNAIYVNQKKHTREKQPLEQDLLLSSSTAIVKQYLINRCLPFPSYIYKKVIAEQLRFDLSKGNKYCDAAFIVDLTRFGSILYSAKPTMDYFIYASQDSASHDYVGNVKLLNYFLKHSNYTRNSRPVLAFRLRNLYCELFWNRNTSLRFRHFLGLILSYGEWKFAVRSILRYFYYKIAHR